jgi:3-dehydroquinate synthase
MKSPSTVRVQLGAERSYPIDFRPLRELPETLSRAKLRVGRCLLVTDENVGRHYASPVRATLEQAGWAPHVITVPPGEATKSAAHLRAVYDEAFHWGMDRQTPVIALGGGVVGDLAGFAAATLLRGVPLVQVPTSLIAQVDSSIGGKTGINHETGKNLVGAFYQPAFVHTDFRVIDTLAQREWTSGMAEVIKHALIADRSFIGFLEEHITPLLLRHDDPVQRMIPWAARLKAEVVSEDVHEQGRRAILNFGHTFGHAIERVAGYGAFTHGEAVALGMRAALYLSHHLHPSVDWERADRLVATLPISGTLEDIAFDEVLQAMQSDKKTKAGTLHFVVLSELGRGYLTDAVSNDAIRQAWEYVCGRLVAA